jgi:hypothetical protein
MASTPLFGLRSTMTAIGAASTGKPLFVVQRFFPFA